MTVARSLSNSAREHGLEETTVQYCSRKSLCKNSIPSLKKNNLLICIQTCYLETQYCGASIAIREDISFRYVDPRLMKIQSCLWNEGQESSKQLVQALPLLHVLSSGFYIYLRTAFPAFLHIHCAFGLFTQWKTKMVFCYFCRHCFVRKYMKNLQGGFFYFYLFFTWIRNQPVFCSSSLWHLWLQFWMKSVAYFRVVWWTVIFMAKF